MTPLDKCFELISDLAVGAPGGTTRCADVASCLAALAKSYVLLDNFERSLLRDCLSDYERQSIASLSVRASELAIDENDPSWLKAAILVHDIDEFRYDPRQNVLLLAIVDHAARRTNTSLKAILESLESVLSARSTQYLKAFDQRPLALRGIDIMDMREVQTPTGTKFVHVSRRDKR